MKVVHLTVARELSSGQLKQLGFEHAAAAFLENVEWATVALHEGPDTEPFVRTIPRWFRGHLLRKLYGWLVAFRLSRSCDVLLMRHMTFDPFAIVFAPLIRNRVSVHHAKEVEELLLIRKDWKGRLASRIERLTGRCSVRHSLMILGVTEEIAEYERDTRAPGKPVGVYPNGIDPDRIRLLEDARVPDAVHVAFICGNFSPWHGLDKLFSAVTHYEAADGDPPLTVHLIGRLSDEQIAQVDADPVLSRIFAIHGHLSEIEYRSILNQCDAGIGSLAMERQNLAEGSTLKIREMLAMGLAVYSGHRDVALQQDKLFTGMTDKIHIADLVRFSILAKSIARRTVREQSLSLIEKRQGMAQSVQDFNQFLATQSVQ